MTGIQAIEHIHQPISMKPGSVEKIEFEYKRHGTTSFIGNFDVATGKLICPFINANRTEKNFVQDIDDLVSSDTDAE